MREIRCFPTARSTGRDVVNSWAGSPGESPLGPFWVLRATVEGPVDERTGYLCDIKTLDTVLREVVAPLVYERARAAPGGFAAPAGALIDALAAGDSHCKRPLELVSIQWCVSPHLSFTANRGEKHMVSVTQSFEFSAAHRLYCDELSPEENRRVFGKCANPNGHGHNYVLEVTVSGDPARADSDAPHAATGRVVDLEFLQRTVRERVIARFDHKHLNLDCEEFTSLNPSVENIARVIWDRLAGAFDGCRLTNVRVWETPKTYAEFDGT